MIIGITGTLSAGKGTVVEFLKQNGFKHYSVREYLIEEIKKRGLPVNRDSMVLVANQIREVNSPSYIIEKLYQRAQREEGDCVIESIRTVGEADKIKQLGGFLIAVDADPQKRYVRAITRQSETDNISYEEFLKNEQREMVSVNPHQQNLKKCIEMADFVLNNDKTVQELYKQVSEIYQQILNIQKEKKIQEPVQEKIIELEKQETKEFSRPSWDEYFMKLASLVAERSTCLRHNVGAIIVKDKRIIATGYNGAARGIKDCTERGCLRNELNIPSGTRHEICRAIHAEQNAIIQGAFHGISVRDSIMYCTHTPCMICAKMIANAGIKEVVSYHDYADEEARNFLQEAGVKLRKVPRPSKEINFKD